MITLYYALDNDWFCLVNSMLDFQHGVDVYGGAIV